MAVFTSRVKMLGWLEKKEEMHVRKLQSKCGKACAIVMHGLGSNTDIMHALISCV